jgi:hypothetical protein
MRKYKAGDFRISGFGLNSNSPYKFRRGSLQITDDIFKKYYIL